MGLSLIGSRSSFDDDLENFYGVDNFADSGADRTPTPTPPNPDPSNYKIMNHLQYGENLLIKVKYIGCTNYEGLKVLLFKDTTLEQLKSQGRIDPHFSYNKEYKSPIARFEPTRAGWEMGLDVIFMM